MEEDAHISLSALKVDGGASANDFLMQVQADMINTPVLRPKCVESTAAGVAYLAGLAVGYWKDKEEITKNQEISSTFSPNISEQERAEKIAGWEKAVKLAMSWKA